MNVLQSAVMKQEQTENITIIRKAETEHHIPEGSKKETKIIRKQSNFASSFSYTMKDDSLDIKVISADTGKNSTHTFVFSSDDKTKLHIESFADSGAVKNKMEDIQLIINKMIIANGDSLQLLPDGKVIEEFIRKTLRENKLDLSFSIGILLNGKQFYASEGGDTSQLFYSSYHVPLFRHDILNRNGQLYLYFPEARSYLLSGIVWLLALVLVFTIVLIVLFVYIVKQYRQQKKLNEMKTDFINNMTHEFKTPLATIQLAADTIIKSNSEGQAQINVMAETIKNQSRKIDKDVKNILQSALLEKEATLHIKKIQLYELIRRCIENCILIAEAKNIQIISDRPSSVNINADEELLEKAICNLVENAVKYSYENGQIKINCAIDTKHIIIAVIDNGCGIAAKDLPYIFDKFYKAGSGDIHSNKGYGLGLSFVKKIAELHNGSICVQSTQNKETVFTLRLPL